jgi:hypothetical protein
VSYFLFSFQRTSVLPSWTVLDEYTILFTTMSTYFLKYFFEMFFYVFLIQELDVITLVCAM